MSYSYSSLPQCDSIRLLHLLPGLNNDALEAHLITQIIEDADTYDALSYVWGAPNLTAALMINDHRLSISENLHSIILQLRLANRPRKLWIDAICIDQEDDNERGAQVALMGQIFGKADTVLCWLGEPTAHRISALKLLQSLSDKVEHYIDMDPTSWAWTWTWDGPVDGIDVASVVASASEAHIEALYDSPWFTRLWITQEVSLARRPVLLCGESSIDWKDFEVASRVLARCLKGHATAISFASMNNAGSLMGSRTRYHLITRQLETKPLLIELDTHWSLGRIAWESRHQHCKDDRDRVYAVLSLVSAGSAYNFYVPKPFAPDYTRSVEWAYAQFWARFGGYTSLFYAGLSRRRKSTNNADISNQYFSNDWHEFDESFLPSWCPDLRPNPEEWRPIFSSDYAASTPTHHMECRLGDAKLGAGLLMIRGHRIDVVHFGVHVSQSSTLSRKFEDVMSLRNTIQKLVALQPICDPYPSGQAWIDALGFALTTDMPCGPHEVDHPLQRYLESRLNHDELARLWRMYLEDVIADTGAVWEKFEQVARACFEAQLAGNVMPGQKFQFDPSVELTPDGNVLWKLHEYLGDVLNRHRFIITKNGWMGLAPPDTAAGDFVVVLGGPGIPFIVRDTPLEVMSEIVPIPYDLVEPELGTTNANHTEVVASETGTPVSQLLGPCYIQGIMNGELYLEKRYETMFEWETDDKRTIPKPTICLI
jgi:hypothetical protein